MPRVVLELVDQLAVAGHAVALPDDLDLVVVPALLAARRCRRSRRVEVVDRARLLRLAVLAVVELDLVAAVDRDPRLVVRRRAGPRAGVRPLVDRHARVREAHERAAVGAPAVRPALAELELQLEVPVLRDRVPEHPEPVDRRDAARAVVERLEVAGAGLGPLGQRRRAVVEQLLVLRRRRSATGRRPRGTGSARCPSRPRRPAGRASPAPGRPGPPSGRATRPSSGRPRRRGGRASAPPPRSAPRRCPWRSTPPCARRASRP